MICEGRWEDGRKIAVNTKKQGKAMAGPALPGEKSLVRYEEWSSEKNLHTPTYVLDKQ